MLGVAGFGVFYMLHLSWQKALEPCSCLLVDVGRGGRGLVIAETRVSTTIDQHQIGHGVAGQTAVIAGRKNSVFVTEELVPFE